MKAVVTGINASSGTCLLEYKVQGKTHLEDRCACMKISDLVDYQEQRKKQPPITTVSKASYEEWEQEVIEAFYVGDMRTSALVPRDGVPAVVSKEKVVVVVLEGDGAITDLVGFRT